MRRFAVPVLGLLVVLAIACASEQSPAPPTPDIEATVTAMVEALPTQALPPTLAALPTYTPPPFATPYPTLEPLPTHTPYPTLGPLPTYTPQPTAETLPTYTPYPTPPVIEQSKNNWHRLAASDDSTEYATVGVSTDEGIRTPWVLWIRCSDEGEPRIYLSDAFTRIFLEGTDLFTEQLVLRTDGDAREAPWTYYSSSDYLGAEQPYNVFGTVKDTRRLTIEIPTAEDPHIIDFNVAGLSQQLASLDSVCE